jgi:beta-fructofuranosidase
MTLRLRDWQVLPTALTPGPAEVDSWDNIATWTGSVLQHAGLWYLFYTSQRRAEQGLIQRIGVATSRDSIRWTTHPDNPVIEADPRWYELLDRQVWFDQAWRDPWVFQHPQTGDFHALITARANHGPADERGVIGHARSVDLLHWEVLPPVTEPGDFGQLEVPQLTQIESRYYLLFSTVASTTSTRRMQRLGQPAVSGTHYLMADQPLGPFHYLTDEFLVGNPITCYYAGKLIKDPDGECQFMAWLESTPTGAFAGEISDPLPVFVDAAGRLSLAKS